MHRNSHFEFAFAGAFFCACVCCFAGFAGLGLTGATGAAGFVALTGAAVAALRAVTAVWALAALATALLAGVVWVVLVAVAGTDFTGVLANGLTGLVVACGTAVLEAACCNGFVGVVGAPAPFVVTAAVAGTPAAFGSHPTAFVAWPGFAVFLWWNMDPRLEIAVAAFETVEAAWPAPWPRDPTVAQGFDSALAGFEMALPAEPKAEARANIGDAAPAPFCRPSKWIGYSSPKVC